MDSETLPSETVQEIDPVPKTLTDSELPESETNIPLQEESLKCLENSAAEIPDALVTDEAEQPIPENTEELKNNNEEENSPDATKMATSGAEEISEKSPEVETNVEIPVAEETGDILPKSPQVEQVPENTGELEDVSQKSPGVEENFEKSTEEAKEDSEEISKPDDEVLEKNEEELNKNEEDLNKNEEDLNKNAEVDEKESKSAEETVETMEVEEEDRENVASPANSEKSSGFAHVNVDPSETSPAGSEILEASTSNALAETEMEVDQENQGENSSEPIEMEVDETSKVSDSETGKGDKETSEEKAETENTEFVKITPDKPDEEGTSMDAEDPFGVENLEGEQTENSEKQAISEQPEPTSTDAQTEKISEDPKKSLEPSKEAEKAPEEVSEKDKSKKDDSAEKNAEKTTLPGQDDELCIVPDSNKVVLLRKTDEMLDKEKVVEPGTEAERATTENGEITPVAEDVAEVASEKASKDSESEKSKENAVKESGTKSTTDVIELDGGSKDSDEVEEIPNEETCKVCQMLKPCRLKVKFGSETFSVCSKACKMTFQTKNNKAMDIPSDGVNSKKEKRCASCLLIVETNDERNLSWETMEFCNEECLGKFQTKYGSYCRNCNGSVQPTSLGKYCVRFGYDVRQFCCSTCLEEFKKGLKVCSYCQKDISNGVEGFLAPVGDKGQFKDFCTQECMEKYSRMNSNELYVGEKKACGVCQQEKLVHCEVQIDRAAPVPICSEPCFAAFKFVNKVDPEHCSTCKKYFEPQSRKGFVVFYENEAHSFCNKTCLNVFIIANRKIVPCNWCKVKKYNFDMIKKELKAGTIIMMCSLNCLTLYQVSINAVSAKRIKCDHCREFSQAQYHLTMSDATIRNFCSYNCVMNFQSQYTKSPITIPTGDSGNADPVPTGPAKRALPQTTRTAAIQPVVVKPTSELQSKKTLPVISSVTSLASMSNGQPMEAPIPAPTKTVSVQQLPMATQTQNVYRQQIITRPPSPVKVHNKIIQCKPIKHTKGVSVRPHQVTQSTQTEKEFNPVVPIPVPIHVPFPIHMYSFPYPIPVPIPIPVPVPIFIPTTRNSAKGIFKEIKKIQDKTPTDPYEAELLMMAEMVATDKKNDSDSNTDDDDGDNVVDHGDAQLDHYSPEHADASNAFGEDMLQMALKMATEEIEEPAVDLESELTSSTITPSQALPEEVKDTESDAQLEPIATVRSRKRSAQYKARPAKRQKKSQSENPASPVESQDSLQPRYIQPMEKPDANMALKFTFGVNAWKQWVAMKNAELDRESPTVLKTKLFKTDLLQLTSDELNYSLCLFVKEVRKPNGNEYAPDTIYYLCLGIQQYLLENNRIDNIFTDPFYEKFTDCLNEVAVKFSVIFNDSQYIVTRVEEEHLWESKQLGAHSPHVLLNTLMFFNTKHFNLVTVEEHMQLSFSHIMKHWKRNPAATPAAAAGKLPGSRNVLLRFYPPQAALDANSKKKKVYEQQENETNPLRCPVKLYEFYLSKCPESVKTRNDIFYLLPERSCVPESPVWYSTSSLGKDHLVKMLNRVKMVKEINVALITS